MLNLQYLITLLIGILPELEVSEDEVVPLYDVDVPSDALSLLPLLVVPPLFEVLAEEDGVVFTSIMDNNKPFLNETCFKL